MRKREDLAAPLEVSLLLFFLISGAGWLWEVLFVGASTGQLVNRGFLRGPWLPVYGAGGLVILLLLRRARGGTLLLLSGLVGGGVEYASSFLLEIMFHARWWDYSAWPWNLDGRVCLGSCLAFSLAGWAWVRFVAPALGRLLAGFPARVRSGLCRGLCVLFALDAVTSLAAPNAGAGISFPI